MALFISFEGVDGAGKSTQLRLLLAHLEQRAVPHIFTREPGGTPLAEKIRQLLLDPANAGMPVITEAMLFAASRAEHVEKVIRPALAAGNVVICDRYIDSSLVYQGVAGGLGMAYVRELNMVATGSLLPHRTIVFDLTPEEARKRRRTSQDDRIEQKDEAYHNKVREAYLTLAEREPERIRLIDATGTVDAIQTKVRRLVDELLPGRARF